MRPVGRLSRLLGLAVAVGVFGGITAQAAPVQNKAVVRAVRGTANYSQDRGANWKKLNVGAQLSQNAVIRTAPGSIVDLFLGENGPVVRVTEDTTVGIDRLTIDDLGPEKIIETQLDLRSGRILGSVKKLAAASKYEVKTPQGVAGIRGTRYDISADGTVSVLEGQVVVVYIVQGQPVSVTVNAGQTARPPIRAGEPARLTATPMEIQRRLNNEIDAIPVGPVTVEAGAVPVITFDLQEEPNPDPVDVLPDFTPDTPISPGS